MMVNNRVLKSHLIPTFTEFVRVNIIKEGNRPTRLLPKANMLLVTIRFFLGWVDYALEGSI